MRKIILLLLLGISIRALPCTLKGVTVTGRFNPCKGHNDTLLVTGPNGTTYLWSDGSTKARYITGPVNGDTTISVIAANGACDTTIQINLAPRTILVTVHNETVCLGNCVVLRAIPSGGGSYSFIWSNGATTDTTTVCPFADSAFLIVVSDSDGCFSENHALVVVANCTGINEIPFSNYFQVFPNPNNGKFTIHSDMLSGAVTSVEFYSILGEKVYSATLKQVQGDNIDISLQLSGLYLYRIISEKGELIGEGKFIKQ